MNSIERLIETFKKGMERHHYTFDKNYLYQLESDIQWVKRIHKDEITQAYYEGRTDGEDSLDGASLTKLADIVEDSTNYYSKTFEK